MEEGIINITTVTERKNKQMDQNKMFPEEHNDMRRENMSDQIDLLDLCQYILKFWPLLLAGMLLGAMVLGGLRYRQKYTYTSASTLYVFSAANTETSVSDLDMGTKLSVDFVAMIKSNPVFDQAIKDVKKEMGITLTRRDVSNSLTISHADDTRMLTIQCTTTNAVLSKEICESVTTTTSKRMSEITRTESATLVEAAEVATTHDPRGVLMQTAKGALGCLAVLVLILSAIYVLNDKLRKSEDVEKYLGEVLIGTVPYEKSLVYRKKKEEKKGK